jgi:hypothetical protein
VETGSTNGLSAAIPGVMDCCGGDLSSRSWE